MPTSTGHRPSSNSVKKSSDRRSNIGACNTATNINPKSKLHFANLGAGCAKCSDDGQVLQLDHALSNHRHSLRLAPETYLAIAKLVRASSGVPGFSRRNRSRKKSGGVRVLLFIQKIKYIAIVFYVFIRKLFV